MQDATIDRLITSVLYEGYLLYPYRPSLKNIKRWTIGTIYPAQSAEVRSGTERAQVLTRMLLSSDGSAIVGGEVRFLHLIERTVGDAPTDGGTWQECEERRVEIQSRRIDELAVGTYHQQFAFNARQWREALEPPAQDDVVRCQSAVLGVVDVTARQVKDNMYLVAVTLRNETPCKPRPSASARDTVVLQAFASAHLILRVRGGEFISRIDPPAECAELCTMDAADGLWPVLLGEPGERNTMLCSPIILYDYPEVAPESPGDFFDGTEMDEMLALRVMTLSDEEKLQVAAHDARGRALLRRSDEMTQRQMAQLHGVTRSMRPVEETTDGFRNGS